MELVSTIKKQCADKGTNIHKVEKTAGFPRGSIYKWDDHKPSIDKVNRVAVILGVTIDELIKEEA